MKSAWWTADFDVKARNKKAVTRQQPSAPGIKQMMRNYRLPLCLSRLSFVGLGEEIGSWR